MQPQLHYQHLQKQQLQTFWQQQMQEIEQVNGANFFCRTLFAFFSFFLVVLCSPASFTSVGDVSVVCMCVLFLDYFAPTVRVHRVQKSSAAISTDKKDYEVGWRCEGKSFDPHSCHVEWLSTLQSRLQNRLFPVKHALLRQKKLDAFSIDCLLIPRVSTLQQERLAKQARHLVICRITFYCVSSAFSWSFFYLHNDLLFMCRTSHKLCFISNSFFHKVH